MPPQGQGRVGRRPAIRTLAAEAPVPSYLCTRKSALNTFPTPNNQPSLTPKKHKNTMIKYKVVEGKNLKTGAAIFFGMAAPVNVVKLESLADEISGECTVTAHDIRAVISALEEKIIRHLQNGNSVRLGLLGSFCPTIRSTAAPSPELFTTDSIKAIGVHFSESSTMRYHLSAQNPEVQFQRIDGE